MAPPLTSAWLLVKFHSIIDETQDCPLSHKNATAAPCVAMFESNVLLLIDTLLDFEYRALSKVLFNILKLLETKLKLECIISKALTPLITDIILPLYTFVYLRLYMTELKFYNMIVHTM